jgi:gamma-glutamyltranspeptidase / glutathione hydrolase
MTPAVQRAELDPQAAFRLQPEIRCDSGAAASTAFREATDAALEMLQAGGNAVDAAVAAAWTLAVCEPSASGLGGQSTLLVYEARGAVRIIDGHSYAPAAVSVDTVNEIQQRRGYRACVIPSTPATLAYAQRKYGLLDPAEVIAPAIRVAERGYVITPLQHRQVTWVARYLRESDAASSLFLVNGQAPPVGHLFRQPQLADCLSSIAQFGAEDFYTGRMSRTIADDMRRNAGLISEKDLNTFALPVEREPLWITYRGLRIASAPPPGGGVQLLLGLKILEQILPNDASIEEWYEAIARATYSAFSEREKSPIRACEQFEQVLAEENIGQIAAAIQRRNLPAPSSSAEGPGDTTHLTVSDHNGNVVALTQSIQSIFGAKVANPQLGFVYNNYLCSCPRSTHPYGLRGNCRPQSNAAPTLVLRDTPGGAKPVLALGAAGSRRITSSILQVISSVADRGLALGEAVAAPRIHALLSRKVWLEKPAATPNLMATLEKQFSKVKLKLPRSFKLGSVHALQWLPDGRVIGAADPRRDGVVGTVAPTF